jgi:hypothetical protein
MGISRNPVRLDRRRAHICILSQPDSSRTGPFGRRTEPKDPAVVVAGVRSGRDGLAREADEAAIWTTLAKAWIREQATLPR